MFLRPILLAACLFICVTVTAQDWYAVTDPLDADEPVARISSPGDSADIVVADVTEPAAILGQATDSHFAEYELLISAAPGKTSGAASSEATPPWLPAASWGGSIRKCWPTACTTLP